MKTSQILRVEECAFEPDSTEIRCAECEKPIGEMGTCRDTGFCAACRADLIDAGTAEGLSEEESKAVVGAMLISVIEGAHYNVRYTKRRVLHLSVDGRPVCAARGGPHPLTTDLNQTNCKRCLARTVKGTR